MPIAGVEEAIFNVTSNPSHAVILAGKQTQPLLHLGGRAAISPHSP